ncbi:ribonucleotide reductase-like protein [Saguinine gammaherpesvirus 1]|uniref:Ribonucleoside-diphosphate reductase n=1 Tax=Saguinine gammaherpesvirus 1 TaxID=2169901 RepID=A0A9Q8QXV6_9GAMA|nr:ribonucleotide reductase-like protein [Saguinine gammaherpesvirus 1]
METVSVRTESLNSVSDIDVEMLKMVDLLKVNAGWDLRANYLSGKAYFMAMEPVSTYSISQYLGLFGNLLQAEIVNFLQENEDNLNKICLNFINGAVYGNLTSKGILSAKRYYDTYLLRHASGVYESICHMYVRIAAFCTCQCQSHPELWKSLYTVQRERGVLLNSKLDYFRYFFDVLTSQLVCCATPIIRSAGVKDGNLSSCFIMTPKLISEKETIEAVMQELSALLRGKSGVGIDLSSFSQRKSINTLLKLLNSQVEYFNDGNIRPVSVAAYLEIWHFQIMDFLKIKLPETPERCGSIFQGICVPEIFFSMYEKSPEGMWYLFDPKTTPQLIKLSGEKFTEEYERLVLEKKYHSVVPLKSIMFAIVNAAIKTGSPYIVYKDSINRHHWYEPQDCAINCANLCAEVIQAPGENVSVCNLANICLPNCLVETDVFTSSSDNGLSFSMDLLTQGVIAAVYIINCGILGGDPLTAKTKESQKERSMGIGVQGLADVFAELGQDYLSPESAALDLDIFKTMYYMAVWTSSQICQHGGAPFSGFSKSKLSRGILHCDDWMGKKSPEWTNLRESVITYGVFNSQFIALMPTVGTSQLTGFSDSFYPYISNISSRVSNKEEVMRPNATFLKRVSRKDLPIIRFYAGDLSAMTEHFQAKYSNFMTVFDMCPKKLLDRAKARAPFVDQSQSYSFFLKEEDVQRASFVKELFFHARNLGLKTLMYYCRIKKQSRATDFECLQKPTSVASLTDNSKTSQCCNQDESHEEKGTLLQSEVPNKRVKCEMDSGGWACLSCQ